MAGSRRMMRAMSRLNRGVRGSNWYRNQRRVEKNHYVGMVKAVNYFRANAAWPTTAPKASAALKNPAAIKWRAAGEMASRAYKLETHARQALRRRRSLTAADQTNLQKLSSPPVFKEPTSKYNPDAYTPGKHIFFVCYVMAILCTIHTTF